MGIIILLIFIGIIVFAAFLLKGFDRIAGRGSKQIQNGINRSNINKDQVSGKKSSSTLDKLKQLDSMRKEELITEVEYSDKKRKILDEMSASPMLQFPTGSKFLLRSSTKTPPFMVSALIFAPTLKPGAFSNSISWQ